MPRLFSDTIIDGEGESVFDRNGLGILSDVIACTVTEELDGKYELEMKYPISGVLAGGLVMRGLLVCKPNRTERAQPFRIYRITKPIGGVFTVYARHISYDLTGVAVSPFSAEGAQAALVAMDAAAVAAHPFTFETDIEADTAFTSAVPRSVRGLLLGEEGSMLSVYKGDFAFDRYTVKWQAVRGADNGVTIAYGKNLTDLKQEENCAEVYTGIYPYYVGIDEEGVEYVTELSEKVLYASGEYTYTRILPVDLSAEFPEDPPSEEQLRSAGRRYMTEREIGVPKVNLTVSFLPLADTDEYRDKVLFEEVALGDTVRVLFSQMQVDATARVTKTVYNCLTDKYNEIHVGSLENRITSVIAGHGKALRKLAEQIRGVT